MTLDLRCVSCGAGSFVDVLSFEDAPVFCNVLYDTEKQGRDAATGSISLVQCVRCGLLMNSSFDPELAAYAPGYENSLHHSSVFQQWATTCAERLVRSHDLRGGSALEIGCGRGGFLSLLRDAGMSRLVGYDPSLPADAEAPGSGSGIDIHRGFFEPDGDSVFDLALSRHVLEHVTDPAAIVNSLAAAAPSGVLYLEVPDASTMLRDAGIYDLIYEHCSYFSAPALRALVERCGLAVVDSRTEFGDQYLSVDVRRAPAAEVRSEDPVDPVLAAAEGFAKQATQERSRWAERLADLENSGKDVVVWGAGSKGVTFVNLINGGDKVSRLVDLNPLKRDRFVPVTAQRVVSPDDLRSDPPQVIIVMNRMYRDEVSTMVGSLGISAEVVVA